MARYKKDHRYLSEEEYQEEQNSNWVIALFLIGAIASGYFATKGISDFDLPKWLKFVCIIIIGLVGGGMLSALYKQIQLLIGLSIFGIILYLLGSLLWDQI